MWQVKSDNFDVKFTFRHVRGINYFDGKTGHTITDATLCDLVVNDQVTWGMALCSDADNFNKEVGRKVALKRAIDKVIEEVELPKTIREQIWARYFDRTTKNETPADQN